MDGLRPTRPFGRVACIALALEKALVAFAAARFAAATLAFAPGSERAERQLRRVPRYAPTNTAALSALNLLEPLFHGGQIGRRLGHRHILPDQDLRYHIPNVANARSVGNVGNLLVPPHVTT